MQTKKILIWAILIGIFVVPFIPLIVTGSMFFPYITGKNFAFRIIAEIVFGLWLVLAIWDRSYRPKKSVVLWSALTFLVVVSLATVFSLHPEKSFWSNFERMEGLITYLHLVAYFIAVGCVLKTERIWGWFLGTTLVANFFVLVHGFLQLYNPEKFPIHQGGLRIDASLGNAIYLAVYMLFIFFLTLFLIYRKRSHLYWVGGLSFLAVLQATALFYTATRGAMLGLVFGLSVCGGLFLIGSRGSVRRIAGALLVVMILLVGGLWLGRDSEVIKNHQILNRLTNFSFTEGTIKARFLVWDMSLQGFKEHPVLGWGPENYNLVFNKYYSPEMWGQEPWFDRSHNILLDWLISAGVLGLLAYLSIFIALIYVIWGKVNQFSFGEKTILTGLLSAYLINNIFVFDNLISYLMFFSFIAYVYSREIYNQEALVKKEDKDTENSLLFKNLATTVVVVALVASVYFFNVPGISRAQGLIDAITSFSSDTRINPAYPASVTTGVQLFEQMIEQDGFLGRTELREQTMVQSLDLGARQEVDENLRQNFLSLAYTSLKRQADETAPDDARSQIFMGSFLTNVGMFDESLVYLEKARQLSLKKPTTYFSIANTYFYKGDREKALAYAKQAYDLNPKNKSLAQEYLFIVYNVGGAKIGDELLKDLMKEFDLDIIADANLINYFSREKQYDKLIQAWKILAEKDPANFDSRKSLAGAYIQSGQNGKALEVLENSKKDFFDREAEINGLIEAVKTGNVQVQ